MYRNLLILSSFLLILCGCDATESDSISGLRVFIADPAIEQGDWYLDQSGIEAAIPYGSESSYITLYSADEYEVDVRDYSSDTILFSEFIDVSSGKVYTLYLVDASLSDGYFILEDAGASEDRYESIVRLVNAGNADEEIAIEITSLEEDSYFESWSSDGVAYKEASSYITIPDGEHTLKVYSVETGELLAERESIVFDDYSYYSVVLIGSASSNNYSLRVIEDLGVN